MRVIFSVNDDDPSRLSMINRPILIQGDVFEPRWYDRAAGAGPTRIRSRRRAGANERILRLFVGAEDEPEDHDIVLYECAFPKKKNDDLREAGVNVILKSFLSTSEELVVGLLKGGVKFSEIPSGESEFSAGDDKWIQTLRSQDDLPPVDFVVSDCYGAPRSVNLLRARARVPGMSWCGNFGNIGQGLLDLENVYTMINTQLAQSERQLRWYQRWYNRWISKPTELTPIFSAHFLGWGAEGEQPLDHIKLEPFPGGVVGPTRVFFAAKNNIRKEVGPLYERAFKIPISLVSNLPTAERRTALPTPTFTGENAENREHNVAPPAEVQAIRAKMDELGATRLIYIAFGTQGFGFKKAAYREIIEEAAAVPSAVVFFVIPPAADWKDSPAYPYKRGWEQFFALHQTERVVLCFHFMSRRIVTRLLHEDTVTSTSLKILRSFSARYDLEQWESEYYSAPMGGEALQLPQNVLLSTWAPQKAIFETFGGPNMVFFTHGGAGSLSEGIANDIALACFGLAFDQPGNCANASLLGLGVDLRRFAKKMLLDDKTIETPGGDVIDGIFHLTPERAVFDGDETPAAGQTIRERIDYIFGNGVIPTPAENPFQQALAREFKDLQMGAFAQDAVVGAFEKTMEEQLRLYKELGLFDGGRGMERQVVSRGCDEGATSRRQKGHPRSCCEGDSCFSWLSGPTAAPTAV